MALPRSYGTAAPIGRLPLRLPQAGDPWALSVPRNLEASSSKRLGKPSDYDTEMRAHCFSGNGSPGCAAPVAAETLFGDFRVHQILGAKFSFRPRRSQVEAA